MSHVDCDTVPFMWQWAKNFVLFDNFAQTIIGPSTPNAIAIIAGQSGETQWALHNEEGPKVSYVGTPGIGLGAIYTSQVTPSVSNDFVPVIADPGPFPGSNLDHNAVKPPYNFDANAANPTHQPDLRDADAVLHGRQHPPDHRQRPGRQGRPRRRPAGHPRSSNCTTSRSPGAGTSRASTRTTSPIPTSKQGTGTPNPNNDAGLYTGYVLHHNGPEYFGYLGDNTEVLKDDLHGVQDFFDAVENKTLPDAGGVFYVRGGYNNNDGLVPIDPNPAIQHAFLGNDDHPAYSDAQISEALAADTINAIANSPYWSQSAIIITYDETDGLYDHVQPKVRSHLADGTPHAGGPRIPTILISPYAAAGTISHQYSEHSSVIKLINEIFGLVPLAMLPDEVHGRELGQPISASPTSAPPTTRPMSSAT